MSDQPKPLYALVAEWRAEADAIDKQGGIGITSGAARKLANELEAALRAWEQRYRETVGVVLTEDICEQILGLPAKET